MFKKNTLSTAVLLAMCMSTNAYADSTDPDETVLELEDVVIYGSKAGKSRLEIPASISVLDSEMIEKANMTSLRDVVKAAPNVSLNQIGQVGNTSISIRGIQSNPFVVNRVAVYLDGIPFRDPEIISLMNIEQIEFLRGPQSTQYGANADAGIIVIKSKDATDVTELSIGTTYRNFESGHTAQVDGRVSGKITPDLGGVFNFRYQKGDSYIKNIGSSIGEEGEIGNLALAGKFNYQLDASTKLNVIAIYNKIDAPGLYEQEFPALNRSLYNNQYATFNNAGKKVGRYEVANDAPKKTNETEWALGFDLEKELDAFVFNFAASYRDKDDESFGTDLDLTASPFVAGGHALNDDFLNVEARFSSPKDANIKWLAGINYYTQNRERTLATLIGPGSFADFSNAPEQRFKSKDVSVFGQLTYPITERLNLVAGLRYEVAKRDTEQDNGSLDLGALGAFSFPAVGESTKDKTFIPKLALNYTLSNNASLYATAAKGYMPGGYNLVAASNGDAINAEFGHYKKEELWSYEIGTKGYLFDRKVYYSAAVFYIDASSWQENRILTDATGRVISTNLISSDAALRSKGVELEISAFVTDKLEINAGLGYTDAEYTDYQFSAGQNLSGNKVYLIPKFDGYLSANYYINDSWFVRGEVQAIGKTPLNPEGTATRDAVYVTGISTGYEADHWSISAFVENLGDKRYASGQAYQNFLFGDDGNFYAPLSAPRVIGITGKLNL